MLKHSLLFTALMAVAGIAPAQSLPKPAEFYFDADANATKPVATLPLAPARRSDGLSTLQATLPAMSGRHDLCFTFASGEHNPMWVVDEVTLLPGR